MTNTLALWLMIACGLLAGLAISALLVDRDIKRRDLLRQRLAKAASAELRIRKVALRSLLRSNEQIVGPSLVDQLAQLPGFDVRKRHDFPQGWAVILVAALVISRLLTALVISRAGALGWLVWPVAMVMLSRWAFAWQKARRDALLLLQFPDALGMLVRSVRAGLPLTDAVRVVARESPQPTASQFQQIVADLMIGMAVSESLTRLAARTALAEYHFFATALTLQTQTGGRLSETLEGLGDMIRKRVAAKDRALALASEARTSALILAALPVVSGVGMMVINWSYMAIMFSDPQGNLLLGAAVGCLGAGLLMMHLIIQRSVT